MGTLRCPTCDQNVRSCEHHHSITLRHHTTTTPQHKSTPTPQHKRTTASHHYKTMTLQDHNGTRQQHNSTKTPQHHNTTSPTGHKTTTTRHQTNTSPKDYSTPPPITNTKLNHHHQKGHNLTSEEHHSLTEFQQSYTLEGVSPLAFFPAGSSGTSRGRFRLLDSAIYLQ